MTRLRIEAPASSANLGPGFDTLGLALDLCNIVYVDLDPEGTGQSLAECTGPHAEQFDPEDNLLCAAYRHWGERIGVALPGARFTIEQHIPVGRGLGASAAAIVAGLAAAASASGEKHARASIVRWGSLLEGHADNAVAATLGGLTTAFIAGEEVHALQVATHLSMGIALFVPDEPLLTSEARACLPASVPFADAVFNIGRATYLATALVWGRWESIGPAMRDRLHQPHRAHLLPALDDVIAAAESSGAYGAALSGGGPAVIALCPRGQADTIAQAMESAAHDRGWAGQRLTTSVRHLGVSVTTMDSSSPS